MPNFNEDNSKKDYYIRNLHSYIKKDDLKSFIDILNKRPNLLNFKSFKNENILFYSLISGSNKISSYLITHKPELLIERNNLGRNCAQNLASKQQDLSLFFKGLSLLSPQNVHLIFANIDNLGNNLLMYCALYDNINVYNKALEVCPQYQIIHKALNKKDSNILHFLASNPYSTGKINFSKHSEELFTQLTNSHTTVLMFAAESQPHNIFKQYLQEFDARLSKDDFQKILTQKNLLNFNILDFSFFNENIENANLLLKKFPGVFPDTIGEANLPVILKRVLKNKNKDILNLLLEHYQPFNDDNNLSLPIIKLAIQANDSNPELLDVILDKHVAKIAQMFIQDENFKNNIYQNNLDKIKPHQWEKILNEIGAKFTEDFTLSNLNAIFSSMMYNPRMISENLDIFYNFLKANYSNNVAHLIIAEKLLFVQDKYVKPFLIKHDFVKACDGEKIEFIQYLLQELYDLDKHIDVQDLENNQLSYISNHNHINLLHYHSGLELKKIYQFDKIFSNPILYKAFSKIEDNEIIQTHNILLLEKPFKAFKDMDKLFTPHKSYIIFSMMINQIAMHNLDLSDDYNDFITFQEIYIKNNLISQEISKKSQNFSYSNSEKLESVENLFEIFNNQIIEKFTIENSLHFLKFISENISIVKNNLTTDSFPSSIHKLLNRINSQTELEKQASINELISINTKLNANGLHVFIPNEILKNASTKDKNLYNKEKTQFFKNNILNSVFNPLTITYDTSTILFPFNKVNVGVKNLDDILNNINITKYTPEKQFLFSDKHNSSLDRERYYQIFFNNHYEHINKSTIDLSNQLNKIIIKHEDFTSLLEKYLVSHQIEKAVTLYFLVLKGNIVLNDINDLKTTINQEVDINPDLLKESNALLIYQHNCIESLIPHKEKIIQIISSNIKQCCLFEKILYMNLCDKLSIHNKIPNLYNELLNLDSNNPENENYLEFTYEFLLKNQNENFLENVDFSKIKDLEVAFTLEENYLSKVMPTNSKKTKVHKH